MSQSQVLISDFLVELIKCCFVSDKILEICKKHLQLQYLENDQQKKLLKHMFNVHDLEGKLPTLGTLSQAFSGDKDVITLLAQIKKSNVSDQQMIILDSFSSFIKRSRFILLYDRVGDMYNQGKHQEAIDYLDKESTSINSFNLKDTYYTRVFQDFQKRQELREREIEDRSVLNEKCVFGIPEMDAHTKGGFNKGTSVCILARSGGGKSTFLRWIGLSNARLGKRVVHFQGEGTEKDCLDTYDAGWTSIDLHEIELGIMPQSKKDKIYKTQKDIINGGGEIFVYASETFDSMSINDCREKLMEIESIYGKVDLVLFDYMEILTVNGAYSTSESGERKRREDLANKITNIAVEFKVGVATATQANDIMPKDYNNPDFVLTRHHISEYKGAIKPFSYFLTVNMTDDERERGYCRIYADKFRKYRAGLTWVICQSLSNSRFYDHKRTVEEFGS